MLTDELDYELPAEAIAQTPVEPRDSARLLRVADDGRLGHRRVNELPSLVEPGDVVVINDTRVRHARLNVTKPTGGRCEVLLLDALGDGRWEALVGANRPVDAGTSLTGADGLTVIVGETLSGGRRVVEVDIAGVGLDESTLESAGAGGIGEVPLPPYVTASLPDPDRYQTVYANQVGSVAAPTAGLHLTDQLMDAMGAAGATFHRVRLDVGIGTFQPIRADVVAEHAMHRERFWVPEATMAACRAAPRVWAIGTTTVRALESAALLEATEGETDLFITRSHRWRVVDRLMTNFHTPRSSLLVMLDAFMGPRWRSVYEAALADGYRFLSLGDAMLVDRPTRTDGSFT